MERMEDADTICAISTPPGEGGIGIIRLSGEKAHEIVKSIFKARKRGSRFTPRKLYLGYITNPATDQALDEVFIVLMPAPDTYTRENIAEIYSHGGYGAQQSILSLTLTCGARLAEPGEFTKRAFLNGRIDLLQAESVLDIIRSETDEELHYAVKYLRGALSKKMEGFRVVLKDTLVAIEALIDFPEEDIDIDINGILPPLEKVSVDIEDLIHSYYEGRGIKQGFEVLIAGKTNVGKSSLLNTLLTKERAIVTPFAGTTRDLIEDVMYLKGMKIKLIDTAGMRKNGNIVEKEGIKRVKEKISEVDLIIWLLDGSQPYSDEDEEVFRAIHQQRHIVVINKTDLPQSLEKESLASKDHLIYISALNGAGIDELKEKAFLKLTEGINRGTGLLITNMRHRDALIRIKENLDRAIQLKKKEEPLELIAFELHESLHHLAEITGENISEEVLHQIFHQFCIGK